MLIAQYTWFSHNFELYTIITLSLKVSFHCKQGLGSPPVYNEMPLPLEVGSFKIINSESMDDSYIDEVNNSDSDGDVPYFSDVEAMVIHWDPFVYISLYFGVSSFNS